MPRTRRSKGSVAGSDDSSAAELGCCLAEILFSGISCFSVSLLFVAVGSAVLSFLSLAVFRTQ
ncbi:MAG: hypothetical protein JST30_08205 [Armatimonadetes bacterium]|nr:hypothetical protein [Armatimonadota bacterium]